MPWKNTIDIIFYWLSYVENANWTRQIDNLIRNAFDDATLLGSCQVLCQLKMTYFLSTFFKRTSFIWLKSREKIVKFEKKSKQNIKRNQITKNIWSKYRIKKWQRLLGKSIDLVVLMVHKLMCNLCRKSLGSDCRLAFRCYLMILEKIIQKSVKSCCRQPLKKNTNEL